ncbi:MAG TPA: transporter [Candidatus Acidoferrum sp.]|jgi:hypothetical protein|nr:transporter [Candidatus Acidoferrum sp.]
MPGTSRIGVAALLRGLSLALTFSSIVHAQDSAPIVTDRPDVTEAANVVPRLSVQVENGLTWTVQDHQHTVSGTETLLRVGIGQRFELRVGVPDYFLNLSAGRHPDGFNDLSLGLKQQVGPVAGNIQLSIIAATSLPSGTGGVSTHGIDPFLKVPWSKELQPGWSIGGMQSIFWTTENGRRNPTGETTVYVEKEVIEPWALFLEYAGDFASLDRARQLLHIGMTYRIGLRHQVDAHVGFGLSAAAPNHFVAVGYSFRLDSAR